MVFMNSSSQWFPVLVGNPWVLSWADDDLLVIYNSLNGDTHLLEPLAGMLLQTIETGPCSTKELLIGFADVLSDEDKNNAQQVIKDTLKQLHDVGLIFSTPN